MLKRRNFHYYFLFCRRGGKFRFCWRCGKLGQWWWVADCWPLQLPLASLLSVWTLLLFSGWSAVSFSVGGGLRSFRLIISWRKDLILRSSELFSICSLVWMYWISFLCCTFISRIVSFSFRILLSLFWMIISNAAILLSISSFPFSAEWPSVLFTGSLTLSVWVEASQVMLDSTCVPASHFRIISTDDTWVPLSDVRLSVVVAMSRVVVASLRLLFQQHSFLQKPISLHYHTLRALFAP